MEKFENKGSVYDLTKSGRTRKQIKELKEEIEENLVYMPTVFATQLLVSHSTVYCGK